MFNRTRRRVLGLLDERVLRHLPGRSVQRVRIALLRLAGAVIGDEVILGQGVRVVGPTGLTLGDGVSIARDSVLDARGGLKIEEGALVGFESVILTSTHNSASVDVPVQHQGMFVQPVSIGARSWLGTRCVIQPGVSIGPNVIVGSAAVVTKDLASDAVYAGVPARYLRDR